MYSNQKGPRSVSRRVVLGTAGVGAVGAAAATFGITKALDKESGPGSSSGVPGKVENAGYAANAATFEDGPLVAQVSDPNGEIVNIFYGTSRVEVVSPKLVADLLKAARSN
jgi:hypothetical protein